MQGTNVPIIGQVLNNDQPNNVEKISLAANAMGSGKTLRSSWSINTIRICKSCSSKSFKIGTVTSPSSASGRSLKRRKVRGSFSCVIGDKVERGHFLLP